MTETEKRYFHNTVCHEVPTGDLEYSFCPQWLNAVDFGGD